MPDFWATISVGAATVLATLATSAVSVWVWRRDRHLREVDRSFSESYNAWWASAQPRYNRAVAVVDRIGGQLNGITRGLTDVPEGLAEITAELTVVVQQSQGRLTRLEALHTVLHELLDLMDGAGQYAPPRTRWFRQGECVATALAMMPKARDDIEMFWGPGSWPGGDPESESTPAAGSPR